MFISEPTVERIRRMTGVPFHLAGNALVAAYVDATGRVLCPAHRDHARGDVDPQHADNSAMDEARCDSCALPIAVVMLAAYAAKSAAWQCWQCRENVNRHAVTPARPCRTHATGHTDTLAAIVDGGDAAEVATGRRPACGSLVVVDGHPGRRWEVVARTPAEQERFPAEIRVRLDGDTFNASVALAAVTPLYRNERGPVTRIACAAHDGRTPAPVAPAAWWARTAGCDCLTGQCHTERDGFHEHTYRYGAPDHPRLVFTEHLHTWTTDARPELRPFSVQRGAATLTAGFATVDDALRSVPEFADLDSLPAVACCLTGPAAEPAAAGPAVVSSWTASTLPA